MPKPTSKKSTAQKSHRIGKAKKASGALRADSHSMLEGRQGWIHRWSPNRSKSHLLVLGSDDPETALVIRDLVELDVPFVAINLDNFIFESDIFETASQSLSILLGSKKIPLEAFKAVFYRRPGFMDVLQEDSDLTYVEWQFLKKWQIILRSIERQLAAITWFPARPSLLGDEAQEKIADLRLSKKLGLKTPKSVRTRDLASLENYLHDFGGEALIKEMGFRARHTKEGVKVFSPKLVKNLRGLQKAVELGPVFLQQHIKNAQDIRCVACGNKVYGHKISIVNPKSNSFRDWRTHPLENLKMEPLELPAKVRRALRDFLKVRGLQYACFDLLKTSSGVYYFLEMNRPGAWHFSEVIAGLPVSKAIASEIKKSIFS
ncbi:MAG: hypothetical protein COT74_09040 [Bdellovibrionales bacterium CG10_big_fil_rev_8_21_14_0_10_45_34]|nr:MAG: hypothetical protein COT74_09040 [Bdellovibrionales bacterium CG10_big_fil_rev_8_21_14_0_10_45_34]